MNDPFLEQKNLSLLSTPAYNWAYCEAETEYHFGGDTEGPVPRAFMALSDGSVTACAPGVESCEQVFPIRAGMFLPAALGYINPDTTVNLIVFF